MAKRTAESNVEPTSIRSTALWIAYQLVSREKGSILSQVGALEDAPTAEQMAARVTKIANDLMASTRDPQAPAARP